ncbi:MAG: LOG family protein [Candidatus Colwellbacteria bacterium]|nr:LOG family protein [Candidatus Colwellbacteria bacterium]
MAQYRKSAAEPVSVPSSLVRPYCLKCTIGISGAAETGHCASDATEKASEIGAAVARAGLVLVTGATTGVPYWAARAAKEGGGLVIGFSPAKGEEEHTEELRLPLDYHDIIVYTGSGYSGANLMLVRSVESLIIVCGDMGTLNEFTTAFEVGTPVGVLTGSGGTADMVDEIVKRAESGPGRIIYDANPSSLVEKLIARIGTHKAAEVRGRRYEVRGKR